MTLTALYPPLEPNRSGRLVAAFFPIQSVNFVDNQTTAAVRLQWRIESGECHCSAAP
jgi:hypothetical protein